jgi:Flp pilus assembly protein TadG
MDEAGMKSAIRFCRDELGGSAAEFAIVVLPFGALIFAIIHLCMLFYANQSLQFATEAAARCYSVDSTNCSTIGAVQTYASGRYAGPNIGAVFTPTASGCGHTVVGVGNYTVNAVVIRKTVTLNSTACFP